MKKHFYFGEKIKEYDVRVLNEREVRAGAGILFFFAMIAFFQACTLGNLYVIQLFVIAFLIDFIIRVLINPKYSPSLTLGRLFVSSQKPEYVGAPQKRFARAIGLILAIIMFFTVVIQGTIGPVNAIICVICLIFLFFESVFGICIGCYVYNLFNKEKAQLCPGGVCEIVKKEPIQKTNRIQILILILAIGLLFTVSATGLIKINKNPNIENNITQSITEPVGGCTSTCMFSK
ncbi:DUF4395 domain-containing protein [Candidatus Gracilibacteria bacterium]|nr:DUF4395 domain-containing protein [Candidatus Gracilibacteria bacterium]